MITTTCRDCLEWSCRRNSKVNKLPNVAIEFVNRNLVHPAIARAATSLQIAKCLNTRLRRQMSIQKWRGAFTRSYFDGADQLVTSVDLSGTTNYGFDLNGNQDLVVSPTGARTTSNWSYENQVELIILPSGGRVTAVYNAENRRTRLQS